MSNRMPKVDQLRGPRLIGLASFCLLSLPSPPCLSAIFQISLVTCMWTWLIDSSRYEWIYITFQLSYLLYLDSGINLVNYWIFSTKVSEMYINQIWASSDKDRCKSDRPTQLGQIGLGCSQSFWSKTFVSLSLVLVLVYLHFNLPLFHAKIEHSPKHKAYQKYNLIISMINDNGFVFIPILKTNRYKKVS